MRCPYCNSETGVIDKRDSRARTCVRRRRKCPQCLKRFTTRERIYFDEVPKTPSEWQAAIDTAYISFLQKGRGWPVYRQKDVDILKKGPKIGIYPSKDLLKS